MDKTQKSGGHAGIDGQGYEPKLSFGQATRSISALGMKKANTHVWQLFLLAMLAGLYVAFGGQAFLVALQEGMGKIVGGAVFSVGLVLVVVAGAELFTGNIIMIVGAMTHSVPAARVLGNWVTVYLGNFIGSVAMAMLIWQSGLLGAGEGSLAERATGIAQAKLALPFAEAFLRGIFCNMLVVLAIIMATIAKDIASKVLCCVLPIMTFSACGFEHCVANMYLIPLGMLAEGASLAELAGMFGNILPVTLGNVVGGLAILMIHPNRIRQILTLARKQSNKAA